jgi:hypothetical protein
MVATNREAKILRTVACPTCGAPIGQPCRVVQGRPMVCAARKAAWQAHRDASPVDYTITEHVEGPPGRRTHYMLVAPQSAEAVTALRTLAADTTTDWSAWPLAWLGGALRVPQADMPALVRQLAAGGWRTAREDAL